MGQRFSPKIGIVSGVIVLGAAVVLWMAPAFACTRQGYIETHPAQAAPGATVRVDGSHFNGSATEPVNVTWGGTSSETSTLLAAVHPAPDGTFSVDVVIPSNALNGQTYQLAATQADSPPFAGNTTVYVAVPRVAPALVDQPASPVPALTPAAVPAVGLTPTPADASSAQAVDAPVPTVANASPYGVATLRAGAPSTARPLDQHAESKAFGGAHTLSGGLSPWLLLPVGAVGLTLLTGSAAYVARQARRERVLVHA